MTPTTSAKNRREIDAGEFLTTIGDGRKVVTFLKSQAIFTQGDAADAVFYIQEGQVRHNVMSKFGKEAALGISSEKEFFGDGCRAGQPLRSGSVTATTACRLLQIDNDAMTRALHRVRGLSDLYIGCLLARNIRYQEALLDQLFGSSEKRLARILLLQARFGEEGAPAAVIPKVSDKTLADMAGTTLLRVRDFMNKFGKLGFLTFSESGLQVHSSLLNVVLHD